MKYYMSFILLLSLIWIVLDVFPTSNSNLEKLTKNVANNKITSGYTERKLFIISIVLPNILFFRISSLIAFQVGT